MKIFSRLISILLIIMLSVISIFSNIIEVFAYEVDLNNIILSDSTETSLNSMVNKSGTVNGINYTYTGKLNTNSMDLYDYVDNNTIYGNDPNSIIDGFTDPYENLNKQLCYDCVEVVKADHSETCTFTFNTNIHIENQLAPLPIPGMNSIPSPFQVYLFDDLGNHTDWDNSGYMEYESSSSIKIDTYEYTVKYNSIGFTPTHFIIHCDTGYGEWQSDVINHSIDKGYEYIYELCSGYSTSNSTTQYISTVINHINCFNIDGTNVSDNHYYMDGDLKAIITKYNGDTVELSSYMYNNYNSEFSITSADIFNNYYTPATIKFVANQYIDENHNVYTPENEWSVESVEFEIYRKINYNFNHYTNDYYYNGYGNLYDSEDLTEDKFVFEYPLYFGSFVTTGEQEDYSEYYRNFSKQINLPHQTVPSAVVQGLVEPQLYNGLPYTINDNGVKYSLFSDLYDMDIYENISFPFYEAKVTNNNEVSYYHQFNSKDCTVYFDEDMEVLFESTTPIHSYSTETPPEGEIGYFPFDCNDNPESLNTGFGSKFNISFRLSEDGTVETIDSNTNLPTGNYVDSIFEYIGDDDAWIYLDNQLVLDMGGVHNNAHGLINFANNTATVYNAYTFDKNNINDNNAAVSDVNIDLTQLLPSLYIRNGNNLVYNTNITHNITIFTLERDMGDSNLFIRYNMEAFNSNDNILEIRTVSDFSNVNSGLRAFAEQAVYTDALAIKLGSRSDSTGMDGTKYPTYDTYKLWPNTENEVILSGITTTEEPVYNYNNYYRNSDYLVSNTSYNWYDSRAVNTTQTYNDDLTGITSNSGILVLPTSDKNDFSSVKFINQFVPGSNVNVTLSTIYKYNKNGNVEDFSNISYASEFPYNGTHTVTDKNNRVISSGYNNYQYGITFNNYNENSYNYTPTQLLDTITLQPQVRDITISNKVLAGNYNSEIEQNIDKEFTFRIYMGNIFGVENTVVTDFESLNASKPIITHTINHPADLEHGIDAWTEVYGEFTLSNLDAITIKDVPVNTEYSVLAVTNEDSEDLGYPHIDKKYVPTVEHFVEDHGTVFSITKSKLNINKSGAYGYYSYEPAACINENDMYDPTIFGYDTKVLVSSNFNTGEDGTIVNYAQQHLSGNINLSKNIVGNTNALNNDSKFEFKVELTQSEGNFNQFPITYEGYPLSYCAETYEQVGFTDKYAIKDLVMTDTSCSFNICIHKDDVILEDVVYDDENPEPILTIGNVPAGTHYKITELYNPSKLTNEGRTYAISTTNNIVNDDLFISIDHNANPYYSGAFSNYEVQNGAQFTNRYNNYGYIAINNSIMKNNAGYYMTDIAGISFNPVGTYSPKFKYNITIKDSNNTAVTANYPYYINTYNSETDDPTFGTINIQNGEGSFEISDNQYIVIDEIPKDYVCTVIQDTNSPYYLDSINNNTSLSSVTYTIHNNEPEFPTNQTDYTEFVNQNLSKNILDTTALFTFKSKMDMQTVTIHKSVVGSLNNDFSFIVNISNISTMGMFFNDIVKTRVNASPLYNNLTISSTTQTINTITLKANESVSIALPINTTYQITEVGGNNYTAAYTIGANSTSIDEINTNLSTPYKSLITGVDDDITFTNTEVIPPFEPYVLPDSGFEDKRLQLAILFIGMLFTAIMYIKTKKVKE